MNPNDQELAFKTKGRKIIFINLAIFALYIIFRLAITIGSGGNTIPIAPTAEQLAASGSYSNFLNVISGMEGWVYWIYHMFILGIIGVLVFIVDLIRRKKNSGSLYLMAAVLVFFLGLISSFIGLMETSF
jgi:uncharacterized membrane protein